MAHKQTLVTRNLKNKFLPVQGTDDNSTIKTEEEYYKEYASSVAAYTYKKGGWDCMRHYEILMNGCIPLFYGIESCPKNTLTTLPKKLLSDILVGNIKPSKDVIEHLLGLTRDYMTTEHLANRILQHD